MSPERTIETVVSVPAGTLAHMTGEDETWRAALGGFLRTETEAGTAAGHTPLALQGELRRVVRRTQHRWNGPLSQPVKQVPESGLDRDDRLGLRPVARTARGWARGSITWTNLVHLRNRLNLHPEQHRWMCEFGALYRALGTAVPGRDPDWVFLDDFANPALWPLLDQAGELGIELVGAGRQRLHRGGTASVTMDLRRTDDGLTLTPRLVIDAVAAPAPLARPIADHGVYLADPTGGLLIARVDAPLTTEQISALGATAVPAVRIPESGLADFLRDYLPAVRATIEVASSDESVPLPEATPPALLLTVTHQPHHTLTVSCEWEHRHVRPPDLLDLIPTDLMLAEWADSTDGLPHTVTLQGIAAAEFSAERLPKLTALPGVRVRIVGTSPRYRELTGTPQIGITAVPAEKPDWFSLGITVTVDGVTVPFTPLFTALAKGRRRLLLVDGSYLSLAHPSLRRLAELVEESAHLSEWEPEPTLSAHQVVTLWPDFEDLADQAEPAVHWRSLLSGVEVDDTVLAVPAGLVADLRPYQLDGLRWLSFGYRHRLGGVLADDMGLGKTVQCLALMAQAVESGAAAGRPFLVVAPTSVVPGWAAEARRFTPGLTVRTVTATERAGTASLAELAAGADLLVTSYALLRLDFQAYQNIATSTGFAGLLLDEAQFVKNPASQIHGCAADLEVGYKLAITGTPLENSLADLQALYAIVAPGLFPSAPVFQRRYVRPIEQPMTGIASGVGAGTAPEVAARVRADRMAELRRKIRPFLLRRTKEHVAADLPPRQEQILRVDLEPGHRELYELYLQRERRKVLRLLDEEDKRNKFIVFRSLTLLRLLALDASLVDSEHEQMPSAKLDLLVELLTDVIAEGHRALVFSQFTGYLHKVADRLRQKGIEHDYLDGSTRNRQRVIDAFKAGTAPVFLVSLKAGGFGLNLTEADYVFLLDPWWNPAAERQAIDRTHRIGQDRPVMIYRLVAADTIEEKVMALADRKAALFDAAVGDAEFGGTLTDQDIRELLG